MMKKFGSWVLAVACVGGCQAQGVGPVGSVPGFALERVTPASEVVPAPEAAAEPATRMVAQGAAIAPATAPVAASTGSAGGGWSGGSAGGSSSVGSSSGGGAGAGAAAVSQAAVVAGDGQLTVDLHGFLSSFQASHRHLLSAVADIDQIVITVQQGGQQTATLTLTQVDIAKDAVAHTFTGLATGNAIVQVIAYDAQGGPIGAASQVVAITATGTTVANLTLQLVGAPATPGTGNQLEANVTVLPPSGTVVATYTMNYTRLTYGGDGYLYSEFVMVGSPSQNWAQLFRYSPTDGSVLQGYFLDEQPSASPLHTTFPMAYDAVHHSMAVGAFTAQALLTQPGDTSVTGIRNSRSSCLVVDGKGNVYFPSRGAKLAQWTGTVGTPSVIPGYSAAGIDADGNFWTDAVAEAPATNVLSQVSKYAPDGSLLGAYPLPFAPLTIKRDGAGGMWIAGQDGKFGATGTVVHVAADGTVGTPVGAGVTDFCIDEAKNLWLAERKDLVKVLPDGTQAGKYDVPALTVTAGGGYVFAGYLATSGPKVVKLIP